MKFLVLLLHGLPQISMALRSPNSPSVFNVKNTKPEVLAGWLKIVPSVNRRKRGEKGRGWAGCLAGLHPVSSGRAGPPQTPAQPDALTLRPRQTRRDANLPFNLILTRIRF